MFSKSLIGLCSFCHVSLTTSVYHSSYGGGRVFVCLHATLHPVLICRPLNKCYLGDCVHSAEVIYWGTYPALWCSWPAPLNHLREVPFSCLRMLGEQKYPCPWAIIRPHTVSEVLCADTTWANPIITSSWKVPQLSALPYKETYMQQWTGSPPLPSCVERLECFKSPSLSSYRTLFYLLLIKLLIQFFTSLPWGRTSQWSRNDSVPLMWKIVKHTAVRLTLKLPGLRLLFRLYL